MYSGSIRLVALLISPDTALTGPESSFTALTTSKITVAMLVMAITAVSTGVGIAVMTSTNAVMMGSSASAKLRLTASPCLSSFCMASSSSPKLCKVSLSTT